MTDFFENALESVERARFEAHVMTCPPCRAHIDQMRHTIAMLGSLPLDSISPDAERDLLHAFRNWKRG